MFSFPCPNCGKEVKIATQAVAIEAHCPHCNLTFEVSKSLSDNANTSPLVASSVLARARISEGDWRTVAHGVSVQPAADVAPSGQAERATPASSQGPWFLCMALLLVLIVMVVFDLQRRRDSALLIAEAQRPSE